MKRLLTNILIGVTVVPYWGWCGSVGVFRRKTLLIFLLRSRLTVRLFRGKGGRFIVLTQKFQIFLVQIFPVDQRLVIFPWFILSVIFVLVILLIPVRPLEVRWRLSLTVVMLVVRLIKLRVLILMVPFRLMKWRRLTVIRRLVRSWRGLTCR